MIQDDVVYAFGDHDFSGSGAVVVEMTSSHLHHFHQKRMIQLMKWKMCCCVDAVAVAYSSTKSSIPRAMSGQKSGDYAGVLMEKSDDDGQKKRSMLCPRLLHPSWKTAYQDEIERKS